MSVSEGVRPINGLDIHKFGVCLVLWSCVWKNLYSLTNQVYHHMGHPTIGKLGLMIILGSYANINFLIGRIDLFIINSKRFLIIGNIGYLFFALGGLFTAQCESYSESIYCSVPVLYFINLSAALITGLWGVLYQRAQFFYTSELSNPETKAKNFNIQTSWVIFGGFVANMINIGYLYMASSHTSFYVLLIIINVLNTVSISALPSHSNRVINEKEKEFSGMENIKKCWTFLRTNLRFCRLLYFFVSFGFVNTFSSTMLYKVLIPAVDPNNLLTKIQKEMVTAVGLFIYTLASSLFTYFFADRFKSMKDIYKLFSLQVYITIAVLLMAVVSIWFKSLILGLIATFFFGIILNLTGTVTNTLVSSLYGTQPEPYAFLKSMYSYGGVLCLLTNIFFDNFVMGPTITCLVLASANLLIVGDIKLIKPKN